MSQTSMYCVAEIFTYVRSTSSGNATFYLKRCPHCRAQPALSPTWEEEDIESVALFEAHLGGQSWMLQPTGGATGLGRWWHIAGLTSRPPGLTQRARRTRLPRSPQEALHIVQSPRCQANSVGKPTANTRGGQRYSHFDWIMGLWLDDESFESRLNVGQFDSWQFDDIDRFQPKAQIVVPSKSYKSVQKCTQSLCKEQHL